VFHPCNLKLKEHLKLVKTTNLWCVKPRAPWMIDVKLKGAIIASLNHMWHEFTIFEGG
jgi:hypothetical protein